MLSLGGDVGGGSGLGRGGASLLPWSYQVEWVHEGRVWFRLGALVGGGLEGGGVLLVGEGLRIHGYG